jgi:type IV fimbrial biogenesis protein FimT
MAHATGLTLIELLTGLMVLTIGLAITAPSMPALIEPWRAMAAANALHHDLQSARQRALRDRQFITLCPSVDGASCSAQPHWQHGWLMMVGDGDGDGDDDDDGEILQQRGARPTLIIDSGGRHQARFRPDGSARGSNLTLTLTSRHADSPTTRVVLSNTGRSRVERTP